MSENSRILNGTRRSDLNDDQWKLDDQRRIKLEFITYGFSLIYKREMTVDEFICPEKREGHWTSKVTIEYCEALVKNMGCSRIPTCWEYKEQKALEILHPEINWRHIWKHKEEELSIINLIKKGCIILPIIEEKKDG